MMKFVYNFKTIDIDYIGDVNVEVEGFGAKPVTLTLFDSEYIKEASQKRKDELNNKETRLIFKIGDKNIYQNGEIIGVAAVAPYINENGSTMVPVRAFTEAIGIETTWNESTREIELPLSRATSASLKLDSDTATILGEEVLIQNRKTGQVDKVEVINGTSFLPLRFVAEDICDLDIS